MTHGSDQDLGRSRQACPETRERGDGPGAHRCSAGRVRIDGTESSAESRKRPSQVWPACVLVGSSTSNSTIQSERGRIRGTPLRNLSLGTTAAVQVAARAPPRPRPSHFNSFSYSSAVSNSRILGRSSGWRGWLQHQRHGRMGSACEPVGLERAVDPVRLTGDRISVGQAKEPRASQRRSGLFLAPAQLFRSLGPKFVVGSLVIDDVPLLDDLAVAPVANLDELHVQQFVPSGCPNRAECDGMFVVS